MTSTTVAAAMPTFIIIGAGKGGTTSLYHYLGQHPDVYMSTLKEAKFFAYEGETPVFNGPRDREKHEGLITTLDRYQALFSGVTTETAIGEASPHYLYLPKACERIHHHLPNAQLFAILRDPVERAYSSFLHLIRDGREPQRDFNKALAQEAERIRQNYAVIWAYKSMGFYHAQLSRYYQRFDPRQIHVYLYEDLKADPIGLSQKVFRAIGVDDSFVPNTSPRYNVSIVPRSRWVNNLLRTDNPVKRVLSTVPGGWRVTRAVHQWNSLRPQCPPDVRRELVAVYREDILKLQDLIDRDLSAWLRT